MSAIHTKSLTGITSITTPSGVDNVFTVHSNDTTERFRVDLNGNQSIAGILTVSQDLDVDGHTNLDNVNIAGVTTTAGMLNANGNVTITSPSPTINFTENNGDPDYRLFLNGGIFTIDDVTNNIGKFSINTTRITLNGETLVNHNNFYIHDKIIHWADADTRIRFPANDTISMETAGTEAFRIDSRGYFDLGRDYSSNPQNGLVGIVTIRGHRVNEAGDYAQLYFKMSTVGGHASSSIRAFRDGSNYSNGLSFYTHNSNSSSGDGSERLRITSDGKIGINDTSPDSIFSVKDTYIFSCAGGNSTTGMQIGGYDAGANSYNPITVRASQILFSISGTERLRIGSSGQIGIAGANYGSSGQVLTSGGSGSAVSWTTISGTTINNNADNRVITGSGTANTLEGEANLTFNGTNLTVTGNISLPDSTAPDYVGNIYVGSSSDLKIFHNGYDNFIRSGAGNHNIRIDNNAGVLGARFIPAGSSELYHNGGLRAYTVSNGFYAEQAEHNDDFDLLIANKFGSLNNNQRCAITCRVTKDAGGSHGGTNRQAIFGHMYNGSTGGGGYFNIRSNDGTNRDFYMDNNTNLRVNYGPSNIGTTNGTVVGSQSSDIRNKNLVGDGTVSYGLSEVLQLNPIKYQYKKELVDRIGFSAQQVEPIIPESVYDTKQDQDNEGNPVSGDTIKAMYYVDLIPVLVNAIKELKAENDALKKRLDDGGL